MPLKINTKTSKMGNKKSSPLKLKMTYLKQPPNKYTFKMPRVKKWVEKNCQGYTLNLFAGKILLDANEFRVDIDKEMPADHYGDAFEFVETWKGKKFDTIILDPPYNLRKSREKYDGRWIGSLTKIKNILHEIMNDRCIVISFGYDTTGMAKSRGFEKLEVLVICHSGDHNDSLAVVERKL